MNPALRPYAVAVLLASTLAWSGMLRAGEALWDLARATPVHRFSTLFTAQDVRDRLGSEAGLRQAVDWCRRTAVTQVYVETFRDGYQAERATLEHARDVFRAEGFSVSGCITPTGVGKASTGWGPISCYTDGKTQERVGELFRFAAGLFEEVMIDDFWFTDCTCPECEAGRQARRVVVGGKAFPVGGESWADYRCELMFQLSRKHVLAAVRAVNPRCRLILKFPQWYDRFHERGYDVARETKDFDRIWVGTETRDYADREWGGTPQYEGFFLMRWLGGVGGRKCGGGWYDWLGTTEKTYVEQARGTVLGGARESMLFCYGGLQADTGPRNVEALRAEIPELLRVAGEVSKRRLAGVAAYKPPGSSPGKEARVFDFVGMLGIPLLPCHEFPSKARAAFFSQHALKDPQLVPRLERLIRKGRPVLVTDGLVAELQGRVNLAAKNVQVLEVRGDPKLLLTLPEDRISTLRAPLLQPFKRALQAPVGVSFCLFNDGSSVLQNFNDTDRVVTIDGQPVPLAARGWRLDWKF